jgi:hypothetical protein
VDAPSPEFRESIKQYPNDEMGCEQALEAIMEELSSDRAPTEQDPQRDAIAVQTWASLVSYAVARTYAPQSPFRFPGWSTGVSRRLSQIAWLFRSALRPLADQLKALSYSVTISFPVGIGVSITWERPVP